MSPPRLAAVHLATANPGKVAEWHQLLASLGVEVLPGAPIEVDETEPHVQGNARLKAEAAAPRGGVWLADDVGLEIAALGGEPGVLLKRWAMDLGGWDAARQRCATLAGSRATYRCGLALARPGEPVLVVQGAVDGRIVAPSGTGAGLEPCFVADGTSRALSALDPAERAHHHHRHRALRQLLAALAP